MASLMLNLWFLGVVVDAFSAPSTTWKPGGSYARRELRQQAVIGQTRVTSCAKRAPISLAALCECAVFPRFMVAERGTQEIRDGGASHVFLRALFRQTDNRVLLGVPSPTAGVRRGELREDELGRERLPLSGRRRPVLGFQSAPGRDRCQVGLQPAHLAGVTEVRLGRRPETGYLSVGR